MVINMAVAEQNKPQANAENQKSVKPKRRRGDRRDATLVRELDGMHALMPYILPKRADNEAVLNETLDLTAVKTYLDQKNVGADFKYTIFHFVCAAVAKTIQMRPYLNRFYAGHRLYQRNDISFSFVVKKKFADDSSETLVIMKYDPESDVSPLEQFNSKVKEIVTKVRKTEEKSGTMDKIGFLAKIPRPVMRILMRIMNSLDYRDKMPQAVVNDDPYYVTVFITNLGSINMHANYHHLVNWGTNSFFCVVNSIKKRPFFNDDGTYEMKDSIDLGLTIDERIADGVYFAKSLKIMRYFFDHPEDLDTPATDKIDIDISIHH